MDAAEERVVVEEGVVERFLPVGDAEPEVLRVAEGAVGQALGIANVKTVIDTTRFVDATVVIGKDWIGKR